MKAAVQQTPFDKISTLTRLLISVPKSELDKIEAQYQHRRKETKKSK